MSPSHALPVVIAALSDIDPWQSTAFAHDKSFHTIPMLSGSGAFRSIRRHTLSGAQGADEALPIHCPTVGIFCLSSVLACFSASSACPFRAQTQATSSRHATRVPNSIVLDCLYPRPRLSKTRSLPRGESGPTLVRCGVVQPLGRNLSARLACAPIRRSGPRQRGLSGHPVRASLASFRVDPRVPAPARGPRSASSRVAEHGVPGWFLHARGAMHVTLAPRANRSGISVRSRLQPSCRASSCFLWCPVITLTLPDLALDTDPLALWGRRSCSIFRSDLAQCA